METVPLLFDLGKPKPTTRQIADLVKAGGAGALTDAVRRADEAKYQEVTCRSALNPVKGMPFEWTLNPYRGCTHGCHYCYARRYQTQFELGSDDEFASIIFVKTNFVEVLRRELQRRCTVYISVPTVDEDGWRLLEPGTAPPLKRLRAVRELVDAGIRAGVLMNPIVPGITSKPAILERTVKAIADSGARFVGCNVMFLEGGTRDHFMGWLSREFPHLVESYGQLYAGKYAPGAYRNEVQTVIGSLMKKYGVSARGETRGVSTPAPTAAASAEQQMLTFTPRSRQRPRR